MRFLKIRYSCKVCGVQHVVDVPASVEESMADEFARREVRRHGWKVTDLGALCAVHALRGHP